MDRLTRVTRQDTGQTNYTYTDTPSLNGCPTGSQSTTCFTVHTTQDEQNAGDGAIVTQTDYDGLGRKALTWYLAPPNTEIDTQYTYDGKNRLLTVSNPGALTS